MHGQIERKNDQDARHAVYGEEDHETSSEGACAVEQNGDGDRKRGDVDPAEKNECEQERVPRRPFKEYEDDVPFGKTDAIEKLFCKTKVIIVSRGRIYEDGAQNGTRKKPCRKGGKHALSFHGAGKYVPHTKKRIHILSYESVSIVHSIFRAFFRCLCRSRASGRSKRRE